MRTILKWTGIILGGLLVLAAVASYFAGGAKWTKKYEVPVETVSIPTDPGSLADQGSR